MSEFKNGLKQALDSIEYFQFTDFDQKEHARPMAHRELREKYAGCGMDIAIQYDLYYKNGDIKYRAFMNPCDHWLDRISTYSWWADLQRIHDFYTENIHEKGSKNNPVFYKYGSFVPTKRTGELFLGGGFFNPLSVNKKDISKYLKLLKETGKGAFFHHEPEKNFL